MRLYKINKIDWLICLAAGIMLFSCVDDINFGDRFLEKQPSVDVNIDSIFSKGENAKAFLWQLYNHIGSPLKSSNQMYQAPVECLSDIMHSYTAYTGANVAYYNGSASESTQNSGVDRFNFNTQSGRQSIWEGIRKGWILIENLDRVPDLSADEISQLKGETYIIMASRYFDGYRNLGGLPLIDKTYVGGEEYTRGRATTEETYHFIDSLVNCALGEKLPWKVADPINWAGRLTKAAAMALRAKVAVFHASPLFNDDAIYLPYSGTQDYQNDLHVWNGKKDPTLWTKALQYCEDFFKEVNNNGFYALVQPTGTSKADYCFTYREAYWNRGTSEKIFEIMPVHWADLGENNWGWPDDATHLMSQSHQGILGPTLEFMEMFPMADGKNYPYRDIYGTTNASNIDIFANRDPRMYENILGAYESLHEDWQGMNRIQFWKGGDQEDAQGKLMADGVNALRYQSGLANYKWALDYRGHILDKPFSYGVIRMAEMHLLYAEALAQTGNLSKACEEVNKVRARVGLGKIETSNPELGLLTNKDNLIFEILRERACELHLEDSRFYDIVRYKRQDCFTSPLHEIVTYRKDANGNKMEGENTRLEAGEPWPNMMYEKTTITNQARRWWEPGFWTNKWYLTAFPRSEINKEYGLTQNPGW